MLLVEAASIEMLTSLHFRPTIFIDFSFTTGRLFGRFPFFFGVGRLGLFWYLCRITSTVFCLLFLLPESLIGQDGCGRVGIRWFTEKWNDSRTAMGSDTFLLSLLNSFPLIGRTVFDLFDDHCDGL